MKGLGWYDPYRVRTPDELVNYINEVGFLPLFANEVPGFSVEEHVSPDFWWTGDPEQDPWEWRMQLARGGRVWYGKFFDGKCGFISHEWFPVFANYRRGGCTFEEHWHDGRIDPRRKKVMDLFGDDTELNGVTIKKLAGFGKDGEKGFEGTITALQEMTYLTVTDFRQKVRKDGVPYGWHVSIYKKPSFDEIFEHPARSEERIRARVRTLFGQDGGLLIGAPYKDPPRKKLLLPEPEF